VIGNESLSVSRIDEIFKRINLGVMFQSRLSVLGIYKENL